MRIRILCVKMLSQKNQLKENRATQVTLSRIVTKMDNREKASKSPRDNRQVQLITRSDTMMEK
jgi:hypothetical protein